MFFRNFPRLLWETAREWQKDRPDLLAGGLAYFALFSFTPLLVLVIGILGPFMARTQILAQLNDLLGESISAIISRWLLPASGASHHTLTVISILTLLFGATRIFVQLQASLDFIWHVPVETRSRWREFFKSILVPLFMILCAGLFIFASMILDTGIVLAGHAVRQVLPGSGQIYLWKAASLLGSLILFTLLFGGIFKWVPDVRMSWGDVWPGALLTSTLFAFCKASLTFYFSWRSFDSLYGAAGSLLVLMVWVYFSAQIFFFGAVFTRIYSRAHDLHRASILRERAP